MLTVFNTLHSETSDLPDLQFRLQLLQFATLFYSTHSPAVRTPPLQALKKLRRVNYARGRCRSRAETGAVSALFDGLEQVRGFKPVDGHDWNAEKCYLLELLPLFMELSTTIADGDPSVAWMELAAEFMVQAALEQFVNFRESPQADRPMKMAVKALREAFAWGYADKIDADSEDNSVQASLWFDNDTEGKVVQEWMNIMQKNLLKVNRITSRLHCIANSTSSSRSRVSPLPATFGRCRRDIRQRHFKSRCALSSTP